jgi:hypothetical protein
MCIASRAMSFTSGNAKRPFLVSGRHTLESELHVHAIRVIRCPRGHMLDPAGSGVADAWSKYTLARCLRAFMIAGCEEDDTGT